MAKCIGQTYLSARHWSFNGCSAQFVICGFAALFYAVFVFGLIWFAVAPNVHVAGIKGTFIAAAIFGFFVYASYDLTNLALLKDWPLRLSLIDIAWGTLLSGISASAGKFMFDRFNTA